MTIPHALAALGSFALLLGACVAGHMLVRLNWTAIVSALRGTWRP